MLFAADNVVDLEKECPVVREEVVTSCDAPSAADALPTSGPINPSAEKTKDSETKTEISSADSKTKDKKGSEDTSSQKSVHHT